MLLWVVISKIWMNYCCEDVGIFRLLIHLTASSFMILPICLSLLLIVPISGQTRPNTRYWTDTGINPWLVGPQECAEFGGGDTYAKSKHTSLLTVTRPLRKAFVCDLFDKIPGFFAYDSHFINNIHIGGSMGDPISSIFTQFLSFSCSFLVCGLYFIIFFWWPVCNQILSF